MASGDLNILYLAHDLADPAIARRTLMLTDGGARVTPAGFRRTAEPVAKAVNFGQTFNGGFARRMLSVIKEIVFIGKHRELFANANLIIARNLEMLAIAVRGRSASASKSTIVYECLDIHRLLLGKGLPSTLLRALEGWLSKRASALITSSPAFVSGYFEPMSSVRLPVRLMENKVYPAPELPTIAPRPPGTPWRIGWFGVIRCRKSLAMLCELARSNPGRVEVIIRGRPALDQFEDFHKTVTTTPGVSFLGAYKNPDDLAAMYRDVHFTWAIDRYEEGLNSSWLLPNRLYEGGLFGAVPIALKGVETGHALERLGLGLTIAEPYNTALNSFFAELTPGQYRTLEAAALAVPKNAWAFDRQDCTKLVIYLAALPKGAAYGG